MLILCDFFPFPFQNSLICSFLFLSSGAKIKITMGCNAWSLFHHGRCWFYKTVLQKKKCTKKFWEGMRPQETSAIFIHPLLETFSNAVVCEKKALQSATMLSYSSWGKGGIFTPVLSDSVAYVGLNTGKKEVSNLLSNCKPTVCSCRPNSGCKTKSE